LLLFGLINLQLRTVHILIGFQVGSAATINAGEGFTRKELQEQIILLLMELKIILECTTL
jgi:hypothetical protein